MAGNGNSAASFQLGVGFAYLQGQDGNWYVSVTYSMGSLSQTVGIPLDQADEFIEGFAKQFNDVKRQAKRARMGLIVATGNGNVH